MSKLWNRVKAAAVVLGICAISAYSVAAEIGDLSTTDSSNTARFPEGLAAGQTNDNLRALEGLLARGFKDTVDGVLNSTSSNGIAFNVTSNRTGTTSLYTGLSARFVAITGIGNNSPVLSFNSISAVEMVKADGTNIVPGDIVTNQTVDVVYSLGKWWVATPPAASVGPLKGFAIGTTETVSALAKSNFIPRDTSVPQSTEGEQIVTVTYTPSSTNNKLLITGHIYIGSSSSGGSYPICALFDGSQADAITVGAESNSDNDMTAVQFEYYTDVTAVEARTYAVRCSAVLSSFPLYLNGQGSGLFGATFQSNIKVEELAP